MGTSETPPFKRRRLPGQIDLDDSGEFAWVLSPEACGTEEEAKESLDILEKLPAERRSVLVKRLDRDGTLLQCPCIRNSPVLSKKLDDLVSAYRGAT
jgi:hypothetical protein